MSRSQLFRTPHTFSTAAEAVEFFNANRAEGVDPIPGAVSAFLESVEDYEPDIGVVFNVQPSFSTHYIACARPDDHHAWLFCKPDRVVFQVGDPRNVEAILSMWGESESEPPDRLLPTDMWFTPDELFLGEELAPAVEFSLILAGAYARQRVAR